MIRSLNPFSAETVIFASMEQNSTLKRYALVVAGGSGSRMNSQLPKQFLPILGQPVLMHTLACFYRFDPNIEIVLVLPEALFDEWRKLCSEYSYEIPHRLVAGGQVRFNSVKNGLSAIGGEGIVAIHDGVRPLVSPATLDLCFAVAAEKGNATPALPLIESIRQVDKEQNRVIDRSGLVGIQTPQTFLLSQIKMAYEQPFDPDYTDDTMVLERLGYPINLVEGNRENIKITYPTDLLIAETLLRQKSDKVR